MLPSVGDKNLQISLLRGVVLCQSTFHLVAYAANFSGVEFIYTPLHWSQCLITHADWSHRHLFVYQVTKIVPALGLCTLVNADFFQLLVCCCNADVAARSRFVAKTTESEASVYVGVVAIFLTVIPVCLIIVVDVITVANSNTTRRRLQYGHRRFAR